MGYFPDRLYSLYFWVDQVHWIKLTAFIMVLVCSWCVISLMHSLVVSITNAGSPVSVEEATETLAETMRRFIFPFSLFSSSEDGKKENMTWIYPNARVSQYKWVWERERELEEREQEIEMVDFVKTSINRTFFLLLWAPERARINTAKYG